ncbi:hypothetical protein D3C85_522930 [compost metagenome]
MYRAKHPVPNRTGPQIPTPLMNKPDFCPACGARNDCSLADPRTADRACWCYGVTIDPAVLLALPAGLRDQSCLCPRCARVEAQLQAAGASIE